jgi:subtilisin family serine protease
VDACKYAVKYPAAYPEVISVGASNAADQVPSYSLWGGVDIVAPGGDALQPILTTNVGGGYGTISGTSPAAAHITGAVALALEAKPDISLPQLVAIMQQTANHLGCAAWPIVDGCPVDQQGAGLIDAEALVDAVRKLPRD